jgi:anti-sigma28 factor (negative regulator of flagellin synthesis)
MKPDTDQPNTADQGPTVDSRSIHRGRRDVHGNETASTSKDSGGSSVPSGSAIRSDKVARVRNAIRENQYDTESVLEQTARRIVDAVTDSSKRSNPEHD